MDALCVAIAKMEGLHTYGADMDFRSTCDAEPASFWVGLATLNAYQACGQFRSPMAWRLYPFILLGISHS